MDKQFDELSKSLAGGVSRREALRKFAAGLAGVVLADQVKSLDWRARKAVRIAAVPEEVVAQVLQRLNPLLVGGA